MRTKNDTLRSFDLFNFRPTCHPEFISVNRTGFNPSKTYKICVGLKPDLFFEIKYSNYPFCPFVQFRFCQHLGRKFIISKVFLRAFLIPKLDISDFLSQAISDLNKSAKAGLLRAFALAMTVTFPDQMSC